LWNNDYAVIDVNNTYSNNFNENNEYGIWINASVDVEVDMDKRTMYYFINNEQCPFYVNNVFSSPLLFGISTFNSNSIIEVACVKKLKNSSIDPSVNCRSMKWK
jgi:hypothetical protein